MSPDKLTVPKKPLMLIPEELRAQIAKDVLERYINGEQVSNIAPEYNVSDVSIYALLLREHTEAWRDIQTARALARLERNQDRLDEAKDMISLARADKGIKSAQWELERLLRRLYGPEDKDNNPEITIVINKLGGQDEVTVGVNGRISRTIENE